MELMLAHTQGTKGREWGTEDRRDTQTIKPTQAGWPVPTNVAREEQDTHKLL